MIRIEPAGAEALLLVLAEQPDAQLPLRIQALAAQLREQLGPVLIDVVPAWTSLLLHYDVQAMAYAQLLPRVESALEQWLVQTFTHAPTVLHEIPIWYAGEDLQVVAEACALSCEAVIDLHSAVEYRVGAIGFAPGFAYLGELDARLALPRRRNPRIRVPAGSLAIAERQTAIYPQASPGGWHLLGLCPWPLFDAQADPPCRMALGDRVRFVPVDHARFLAEEAQA